MRVGVNLRLDPILPRQDRHCVLLSSMDIPRLRTIHAIIEINNSFYSKRAHELFAKTTI